MASDLTLPGQRRPGRPRSGVTVYPVTVMLPKAMKAWGMARPEGLSALVRRLLRQEMLQELQEELQEEQRTSS